MSRPVLIFNSVPTITVAIARSLHRLGIPVTFADMGGPGNAPGSRAIRDSVRLPNYRNMPAEFIEQLTELIQVGRYDTLLPCSDAGLVAVSDHYARLAALLYVGCPEPHIVKRVLDKDQTIEAAKACGLRVPVTYDAPDLTTLEKLRNRLRFPLIAKPRSKEDERRHTFKSKYFISFQNLRDAFLTEPEFGTQNLLQEYCVGEGVGIEVLLHEGAPVALFQHRRLKELPISGGGSVVCLSEPLNPELADSAVRLLQRLEWRGVAMVEFRYDRGARQATLMEVNGRYWGSLPLAIRAGVDFPLYEWQIARGEKPSVPASYRTGLRLRSLSYDLRRLSSLFTEAPLDDYPLPSKWQESVRFLKDSFVSTSPALWSWRDPVPAIKEVKGAMWLIAEAIEKRAKARIRQIIAAYRYLGWQTTLGYLRMRVLYTLALKRNRPPARTSNFRSVLFICHGNKIRSPMAAALLTKRLGGSSGGRITSISSAGLASTLDSRADGRARLVAKEFGVSLDDHRPRSLTPELVEQADAIFIMDNLNELGMRRLYPHAMKKVFYLGAYADGKRPPRNAEMVDPNLGTLSDIRSCYLTIESCIRKLDEAIRPQLAQPGGVRALHPGDACVMHESKGIFVTQHYRRHNRILAGSSPEREERTTAAHPLREEFKFRPTDH
jgi:protein-tyrosine-phosphatase/predicted ATP-grasp superfamily ATP-dependent carboligase